MEPFAQPAVEPHMRELLAHSAWVQRLARRLVSDPGLADDLVQETYVAALAHSSGPVRSGRAFLGTVLRRLVWERRRREDRRAARERLVAAEEALPSTGDLVERMACHARVVEHVLDLPQHYRDVLLLRYFEGLTPTEIAAREGAALATVKTRLQRGLQQMRERLDRESGGDGQSWLEALAPLTLPALRTAGPGALGPVAGWGAPLAGTALRGPALLGTALLGRAARIAVLLAVGGLGWLGLQALWPDPPRLPPVGALPLASAASESAAPSLVQQAGPAGPRRAAPPEAQAPGTSALPTGALAGLERRRAAEPLLGRVVDVEGRGLGGVVLSFQPARDSGAGTRIAVSAADGSFELLGAPGLGLVEALGSEHVTLAAGLGGAGANDELGVVLANARPLAGVLVDDARRPVPGVELELELPQALLARLAGRGTALPRQRTRSDDEGRFRFERAPDLSGLALSARAVGFLGQRFELPVGEALGLELALQRPGQGPQRLVGHVFGPSGAPVQDALVSLGGDVVTSDASGRFALDRPLASSGPLQLAALHPELGGAVVALPAETSATPAPLELRLVGLQPALAGRVVDAAGRGLPGVPVWIDDPTPFSGYLDELAAPAIEDDPASGRFDESRLYGLAAIDPTEFPDSIEARLAGRPSDAWGAVRTDREGRYAIGGLLPRGYRISAMDPATLGVVRGAADVQPGGTAPDLVLDVGALLRSVRGRLVDAEGRGLAGVELSLQLEARRMLAGERVVHRLRFLREQGRSGPQGEFELAFAPGTDGWLRVSGPEWVESVFPLEGRGPLEFVVERAIELRVELAERERFTSFSVLDAEGRAVPLQQQLGGERQARSRGALHEGRSEQVEVPASSTTLRLFTADGEALDRPLLKAGTSPFVQRD